MKPRPIMLSLLVAAALVVAAQAVLHRPPAPYVRINDTRVSQPVLVRACVNGRMAYTYQHDDSPPISDGSCETPAQ